MPNHNLENADWPQHILCVNTGACVCARWRHTEIILDASITEYSLARGHNTNASSTTWASMNLY